jgi:catechol O-methyltransferase
VLFVGSCSGAAVSRRGFSVIAASATCSGLAAPRSASAEGAVQYSKVEDLLAYVRKYAKQGDANSVIATIDSFSSPEGNKIDGWSRWMMNVGGQKGDVLEELVRQNKPSAYLEVGTFCGYSALRTLRALPQGAIFYTIEKDPKSAAVAKAIWEYAGVPEGRVRLVVGSSSEQFAGIKKAFNQPFDFVLFDHWKPEYAPDAQRLEDLGMIRRGSVLVADNVICPGAPALLEYLGVKPWTGWNLECDANFPKTRAEREAVYESKRWSTRLIECAFEYRPEQPDALSVSVYK